MNYREICEQIASGKAGVFVESTVDTDDSEIFRLHENTFSLGDAIDAVRSWGTESDFMIFYGPKGWYKLNEDSEAPDVMYSLEILKEEYKKLENESVNELMNLLQI